MIVRNIMNRQASMVSDRVTIIWLFSSIRLFSHEDSTLTESEHNQLDNRSTRIEENWSKPFGSVHHERTIRLLPQTETSRSQDRTLHVTSMSPASQVTFSKASANDVIAIVRIPGLADHIRHGTSEPTLHVNSEHVSTTTNEQPSYQSHASKYSRIHSMYTLPLVYSKSRFDSYVLHCSGAV
jgi:hypothetical protein